MDKTYIALLSGGRDSTSMVIKLLEGKMPLDYILFCDTKEEFPLMYEYIDKLDDFLINNYGIGITRIAPRENFSDWVFGEIKRGNRKGFIRGLPKLKDPCYWKRQSKIRPAERFVKRNNIENPIYYVGYTYSELNRSKVKADNQIFPLIDLRMCEGDIDIHLESIDMVNPLYEFFERTGCAICPYQSDRSFYVLYKKFPEIWSLMKDYETKLLNLINDGYNVLNPTWDDKRTLIEIEDMFKSNNKNFSDKASKGCECRHIILDDNQIIEFNKLD